MKKARLLAALGALALFVSVAAWGDNNVLNKGSYFQNATTGQKVDANGNAYLNEAAKDRDNYVIVPVCDDTLSNGGGVSASNANVGGAMAFTAESSLVIPTYMYHHFTLLMRVVPVFSAAADSAVTYRIAVQVRKHTDQTNDSSSTFAWTSWTNAALVATADSTGNAGQTFMASGAFAGQSERTFVFVGARGRGNGNSRQAAAMSWPDGIAVDLIDSRGQWYWSPYTSIRVRIIGNSAGNTAALCPRVICKLAMGS